METPKLSHSSTLSFDQAVKLVPESEEKARGWLTCFWVADVEECTGDPVSISQGDREFSLLGSTSWDDQPYIWDPSVREWLRVV